MGLPRKPTHLSAILRAEIDKRAKADLDRLIDETAELATWTACAEIPMLSIYEKTGMANLPVPIATYNREANWCCRNS